MYNFLTEMGVPKSHVAIAAHGGTHPQSARTIYEIDVLKFDWRRYNAARCYFALTQVGNHYVQY